MDQCDFTAATSEAMSSKRKLDATLNPRFKQLGTHSLLCTYLCQTVWGQVLAVV